MPRANVRVPGATALK
ncbi:hypothetical protein F383_36182 [Gossypium arboreum]|nr:hypothetical protein F383_36182 [Gossypium arboreum]